MTAAQPIFARRTTISLGPLKITREEQRYGASPATAPPRRNILGTLGLTGLICASVGGIAVAASRAPMLSDYVVSVPVPDRDTLVGTTRDVPPPAHRKRTRASRPEATPPDADDIAFDNRPTATRLAAIDAALRTGEIQEWRDAAGPAHGYVVAGPQQAEGTLACRDLSILIRAPGETDHVDQRRECRPAS